MSTCSNKSCSYNYTESLTPRLSSVAPTSGSHGDVITIECTECGSFDLVASVTVGGVDCTDHVFLGGSPTTVRCTLGKNRCLDLASK